MGWSIYLLTEDNAKTYDDSDPDSSWEEIIEVNHTHNCNPMVRDAGIPDWPYDFLDRIQAEGTAKDMIEPVRGVLTTLRKYRRKYEAMNPSNGWGSVDSLIRVLEELADVCEENPNAKVRHWS